MLMVALNACTTEEHEANQEQAAVVDPTQPSGDIQHRIERCNRGIESEADDDGGHEQPLRDAPSGRHEPTTITVQA